MKDSLYTVWDGLKPYVLFLSAMTPFILIFYNFVFGPLASFQEAAIALLFVEVGLIIAIAFEIHRKLDRFGDVVQFEDCSVSNNPIWQELKGKKIPALDICALNGGRIAKCIQDNDISIGELRAIFPSDDALKLYFSDLDFEQSRARMSSLSIGAADFERVTSVLRDQGRIGDIQVRKTSNFSDRISIIPGEKFALMGCYFMQSARSASTGLKVETRLEHRSDLVRREKEHFERMWMPS